jgi:Tfp pilus assembly protein PilZ
MNSDEFERRHAERRHTHHLLDYAVLDERGEVVERQVGRTINVSEEGLLLDTPDFIDPGRTVLVTLALKEEMVELRGRVAHVRPAVEERFHAGIEFQEMDEAGRRVLQRYLESFRSGAEIL